MSVTNFYDSFTGSANTRLSAHAPERGAWSDVLNYFLALDGAGSVFPVPGVIYGLAFTNITPVSDTWVRYHVHKIGNVSAYTQLHFYFRQQNGTSETLFGGLAWDTTAFRFQFFYMHPDGNTTDLIYQSSSGLTIHDNDLIETIVTGNNPVNFVSKINGVTTDTFTFTGSLGPGVVGFRFIGTDSGNGSIDYNNVITCKTLRITPSFPSFTASLGANSVPIHGTTTVIPGGFSGPVTYTSSNPSVATIDSSGNVTAGGSPGSCTFTATGVQYTDEVATTGTLTVTTVAAVSPASTSITLGGTRQLTATGFTGGAVTWGASGSHISVSSSGLVTALSAGSGTVTATGVADNTQTATCTVTVTNKTLIGFFES